MKQPISDVVKALFALDNLLLATIDTTSLKDDADIVRVIFADHTGHILYDRVIQPQRSDEPNTAWTGITFEEIIAAPTLVECWDDIETFLRGSVVVAFNLEFVQSRLRENALHYGLRVVPMVGACTQKIAKTHFQENISLMKACARIGHALPSPAFAPDRVAGQLALLKAISVASPIAQAVEYEDLDDPPF